MNAIMEFIIKIIDFLNAFVNSGLPEEITQTFLEITVFIVVKIEPMLAHILQWLHPIIG